MTPQDHRSLRRIVACFLTLTILNAGDSGPVDPALRWSTGTRECRPWAYNWWLGRAVDTNNLARELRRYRDAGLGGVHVIPIYGAQGAESRYLDYLSPAWFEAFQFCVEEGGRLGLGVDLTTGSGWCFGGPNVPKTDGGWSLRTFMLEVSAGQTPTNRRAPDSVVALLAVTADNRPLDLRDRLRPDGSLDWAADAPDTTLYAVTAAPEGRMVKRAAREVAAPAYTIVVAHRGDHTAAHENSLEAIERAIRAGADYIELDVRATRDGELALMHDATVDRTTDGHGAISNLSWTEVQSLKLTDGQRPNLPPAKVPSLAEALGVLQGRAGLYLDFKSGNREQVVQLLRRYQMVSSTIIYDDREAMGRWKELEPALRTMTSPAPEDLSIDALATLKQRLQIDILDGPASVYTPGLVREIQSRGLPVWPDIQGPWENPQFWDQVVSLGAAGYQTDRPADFIEFLRQRGYREVLDRDRGAIIRSRPDRRQLALVFTGHELYCGGERSRPTLLSREELREDLEANLKRLAQFGVERTAATHFLPPYEHHNEEVAAWTREAGLVLISRVDEMLADEPPRRTVFLRLNQAGYRPGDVKRAVAFTCD